MKKILFSIILAIVTIACSNQKYESAFYEYAGINPAKATHITITEDGGDTIKIPVYHGGTADVKNKTDFQVSFTVSGGEYGTDYTIIEGSSANGTVTIPAGADGAVSIGYIKILSVVDYETEPDVHLTVTLTSAERDVHFGYPYKPSIDLTIKDDDCPFDWVGHLDGAEATLDAIDVVESADVTVTFDGTTYTLDGLGFTMIADFWGENIVDSSPVTMTVTASGAITIAEQYVFTTDYDDSIYNIVGTGQVNKCDGTVTFNYDIVYADGSGGVGAWAHDNNYMTDPIFVATLTPTP